MHRLWQAGGGFDRNLTDYDRINKAIEYIELNPVRHGYVKDPAERIWSSARARARIADVPLQVDVAMAAFEMSQSELRKA